MMAADIVLSLLWEANSTLPHPLAGFEGPFCGRKKEGERKGRENGRKEGKGGKGWEEKYPRNNVNVWLQPCMELFANNGLKNASFVGE